jgi:hypothetical protein
LRRHEKHGLRLRYGVDPLIVAEIPDLYLLGGLMRRQLIRIEESNIAGFRWWSELWLSQSRKGGFRLSVTRSENHVDHDEIGPVDAITSGKQLFEQVGNILNQLGHERAETHHAAIADALSDIDVRLAE